MTGYDLSRSFFDWCFENPDKVSPNHAAIYFFAIEHCNRLGWKDKFGFPTQMTMDAVGIKKHQTYIKYFNDLCEWGFFKLIQKSTNQYSANIISVKTAMPKNGKALDKAFINHAAKQTEPNGQSTGQSKGSIDKQITNNQEPLTIAFNVFWDAYGNKTGRRKSEARWNRLDDATRKKIMETLPAFLAYKPFESYTHPNPETYLNNERWNDEIPDSPQVVKIAEARRTTLEEAQATANSFG